jgi:hypothetical protein
MDPDHVAPSPSRWLIAAAAALLLLAPAAARADAFGDASLTLAIGEDARLFLNITNEHFAPPAAAAAAVVRGCPHPEDDFPVIMMLANASGRPAEAILAMRLRGLAWTDVMFRVGVPPAVLFAHLDRDPGPPFARAWDYWRRHRNRGRLGLSDREIVELTKLQIAAAYYRVNPYSITAERQRGRSIEAFAAERQKRSGDLRDEEDARRRDRGRRRP